MVVVGVDIFILKIIRNIIVEQVSCPQLNFNKSQLRVECIVENTHYYNLIKIDKGHLVNFANIQIISKQIDKTFTEMFNFKQLVQQTVPKVIGVGKNYLKHVIEMGGTDIPTSPILFQKPWTSLVYAPSKLQLSHPKRANEIHHQIELGVVVGKSGSNIPKEKAMDYVKGYFLLLDLTDRDLQWASKKAGLPWDLSKGQDNFLPVSEFIPRETITDPLNLELELKINGNTVQKDNTGNMHYKIDDIIAFTSQYMTLNEGDLILMGTPSGVGPIKPGDHILGVMRQAGKEVANLKFDVI